MPIQPPKRISVPARSVTIQAKVSSPSPQKENQQTFPVDTEYSPEYTAAKIPYNLRAAYVAYIHAMHIMLSLKEMPFRMEKGEVRPEDQRLIIEAKAKVDEFCDRMARKLKL